MAKPAQVLKTFGRAVRERRLALGWSQEHLAGETGLHRTYVSSLERGERNVGLLNLATLARALGCTVSGLLEDLK